jgi:hypothetical protein
MAWHDDPKHPFAGIAEKLKRADENIDNLNTEIERFIQGGLYPVIPHPNSETWNEALSYHRDKVIPLRFSVLAGEVVHHLRSCLDHIVWYFSIPNLTPKIETSIEFPIFEIDPYNPPDSKKIALYERKIKGITNPNVLFLIDAMQPYNVRADVADHALLIVHNMDRFDKHRELVIVSSSVAVNFPPGMEDIQRKADLFSQGKLPKSEFLALSHALNENANASPGIAFRNFGQRSPYPVVLGLVKLWRAVNNAVAEFAGEV